MVKLLLSYPGIDYDCVDTKGRSALHNSVKGKTGGRAKRIHLASKTDSPEVARLLLEKGAKVNLKDTIGDTPLAVAASSYGEKSIEVLMKYGADINT